MALLVALAIPSVAVSSSRGATEQQQDLAHVDTPLANPSVAICGNLSRRAPTAHIITEFDANVPEPVRVAFQAIAARFEELFVLTTDAVVAVGWADFVPSGGGYPEGAFDFPGAPMQRVIYPQVLVKQIVGPNWRSRGIGIHTRPDDRDGTVIFNPTIKWTFEPGGFFEYIAFHELMHAFGFYSSAGQIGRPPWPTSPPWIFDAFFVNEQGQHVLDGGRMAPWFTPGTTRLYWANRKQAVFDLGYMHFDGSILHGTVISDNDTGARSNVPDAMSLQLFSDIGYAIVTHWDCRVTVPLVAAG